MGWTLDEGYTILSHPSSGVLRFVPGLFFFFVFWRDGQLEFGLGCFGLRAFLALARFFPFLWGGVG